MLTGMTIVAIVSGFRHNASELASALTGFALHIATWQIHIRMEFVTPGCGIALGDGCFAAASGWGAGKPCPPT